MTEDNARRVVRRFVTIALVIGTVFVIITPAFAGYDEPYH